ncbi:SEC-C domain-containing protein [Mesorhizobium sp. M1A.F.Ca.ET.072.01.1.1]|uniref:SEC-C domain-containing protein n=1 Tax=Mesorhizobium sp. M1A.F.Ca.ET.072.01.1.1 TaxID=2496753 RepID=UPI001674AFE1|nr:SEC-C domain-containing protein [Mesorhizobium sp. M1A.F.Ca.ET.072.01.1.1]
MGVGRGRNEKCWCGSGRKFKHCHLHREEQVPLQPWEAEKAFREEFRTPLCSAPTADHQQCSGKIIRAHTVPRSGSLNRIARDGHVYAFVPSLQNLTKYNGKLEPELVGVRSASTFTGFCSTHDDAIFAPLEKAVFSATPEQCFLLGYRAFAREAYTKESAARMLPVQRSADRGRDISDQVGMQMFNKLYEVGIAAGLADTRAQKAEYDRLLLQRDFASVRAYVVEFLEPPPVMCAAGWMPSTDFAGDMLQDLAAPGRLASMSFTSFATGSGGAVVFQWLACDDEVCDRFARSVEAIDDAELSSAMVRLMFEYFENVHISPNWWESLPAETSVSLVERMARSANPFRSQIAKPLLDDGVNVGEWKITRRFRVGVRRNDSQAA